MTESAERRTHGIAQDLLRKYGIGALIAAAGCFLVGLGAQSAIRAQGNIARRAIGKPLGEQAHQADKVYKRKKYSDTLDLLLLGDSIAAGLGADKPKHTPGALIAKGLAKRAGQSVRLYTGATVGAETWQLGEQLRSLPAGYRADVAVIIVGGNDVTHRIKPSESVKPLVEAIVQLRAQGTEVVVGTCPDLGMLRPVPQPLRALGRVASRRLASAQAEAALANGAWAVSLARVVGPFFLAQPDEMFALDQFHPSSYGYRRAAKAILPSVLAALELKSEVPFGHQAPDTR